jgi:hypothetical protein
MAASSSPNSPPQVDTAEPDELRNFATALGFKVED